MSRISPVLADRFVENDVFAEHLHSWRCGAAPVAGLTVEIFFVGGKQYIPMWTTPDEARAFARDLIAAADVAGQ